MSKTIDFVKEYLKPALEAELRTNVPHQFNIAQAAIETGWKISGSGNNIFGITATRDWKGEVKKVWTTEYLPYKTATFEGVTYNGVWIEQYKKYKFTVQRSFRKYDTVADCFIDHTKVLRQSNYADAFNYTNDPCKFARAIAAGGYATGPNYANLLCDVIKMVDRIIIDNNLMAICK